MQISLIVSPSKGTKGCKALHSRQRALVEAGEALPAHPLNRSNASKGTRNLNQPPGSSPFRFARFHGAHEEIVSTAQQLCGDVLPHLDPAQIESRAALVANLSLWLASSGDVIAGFKLGYQNGPDIFVSWLGGVRSDFRRSGIAAGLMQLQHDELRAAGFRFVETRSRADNSPMIILNLRHGFRIIGLEIDPLQRPIVLQRKPLDA